MKKNKTIRIIIIVLIAIAAIVVIAFVKIKMDKSQGPKVGEASYSEPEPVKNREFNKLYIGDKSVAEYYILNESAGTENAETLKDYIYKLTGEKLIISSQKQGDKSTIKLEIVKKDDVPFSDISIENGNITIRALSATDMGEKIKVFANTYMGYAFAGSDKERILIKNGEAVYMPENILDTGGEDWIANREPIICLWKTTTARGAYYKANTNLGSEIMSYSDDELYSYVKMMKQLGYNGIQVTEMCSAWASYGGYEYVHDRIRYMADAAHSMGMYFTLWVWGAEFNGYGWDDKTVDYYDNWKYAHAYDNPKALATFEKYYTIYAELADCTDRVIAHFDDPGKLINTEDIAYFSKELKAKFREKNPSVDFGISCYTKKQEPESLNLLMEGDTTYYSGAVRYEEEDWRSFRQVCAGNGLPFGVWSWNLTEMEIDQLAEMNVNANLIKNVYNMSSRDDDIAKPSYWSEMDSYHVLNVFSHYCAASLLRDPGLDADELLLASAKAVAGDEYAEKLYYCLKLIEEARTGDSWEEFRFGYDDYILKSDNYPAEDIYEKSKVAIGYMDEMIAADNCHCTLSLPVSTAELLKMMKPHLLQISEFSKFRADLNSLKDISGGLTTDELQAKVNEIYTPVSEYDVIVGLWGQPEARAQFELLSEFCSEKGLNVPRDPDFTLLRKQRLYSEYVVFQRLSEEPVYREKENGFQLGLAFGNDETAYITGLLIDEGVLSETEDGKVYLTDYKSY
ncbi:MAG: hypothetical protein K5669_10890 [Lachnospiraceae bacterium]|nr:hypothetical protein [Lachnospiraceae bacterium]